MLVVHLRHLYPGQKLEQVTVQKGKSKHLLTSVEVMLENTSVKQAIFVEMTPKVHFWLLTVSDYYKW